METEIAHLKPPNQSETNLPPLIYDPTDLTLSTSAVPKSIDEIYKISILNKKRNKERKRTRDGSTTSAGNSLEEKDINKVKDFIFSSIDSQDDQIDYKSLASDNTPKFDENSYFSNIDSNPSNITPEQTVSDFF